MVFLSRYLLFFHGSCSIANVMKGAGCPVPDYMLQIKKPNRYEIFLSCKKKNLSQHGTFAVEW